MKKLLILIFLTLSNFIVFAEGKGDNGMAGEFYKSGRIYVVIATVAIVFIGLAIYLFSMDRRLKKIEKGN